MLTFPTPCHRDGAQFPNRCSPATTAMAATADAKFDADPHADSLANFNINADPDADPHAEFDADAAALDADASVTRWRASCI